MIPTFIASLYGMNVKFPEQNIINGGSHFKWWERSKWMEELDKGILDEELHQYIDCFNIFSSRKKVKQHNQKQRRECYIKKTLSAKNQQELA